MFAEALDTRLLATLDRPDLRIVAGGRSIGFDARLDTPFRVDPDGRVVLGAACLGPDRSCAFHVRHALELCMLLDAAKRPRPAGLLEGDVEAALLPVLAGLCAARTAARFWLLDAASAATPEPAPWLSPMAAPGMPGGGTLDRVWARVRHLQEPSRRDDRPVPAAVLRRLAACWGLLGPAETLMAEGGDARLRVDPLTGLNHYGCSHRPRPWAITFASSTASSLSERGFGAAEAARRRLAAAALAGDAPAALRAECRQVRRAIGAHYGLGESGVVLAASGTDSEILALAVCALPSGSGPVRPITTILVAPEETGTGVPLAAAGCHFAGDTARGGTVAKGEPIDGMPADTRVLRVAIRDRAGRLLDPAQVDEACARMAQAEAAQGRLVLLHRLDLSKTGLLAPSTDCLRRLQDRLGDGLELLVDACQARLDRRRPQDWLARGWMVMVTGSKFFTGPPFCGALLLPPRLARRLRGPGSLPAGLADYGGDADWPDGTAMPRQPGGPDEPVNLGLVLRWQAALAEMVALAQVPDRVARARTEAFLEGVEAAIAASPDVVAVEVPAPARDPLPGANGEPEPCWDQLQTIRSLLVLAPGRDGARLPLDVPGERLPLDVPSERLPLDVPSERLPLDVPSERLPLDVPGERLPLDVPDARRVYRWLNADVMRALPADAPEADRALARLLCHVGQPAPVADDRLGGAMAGALRISVGARLLSGEPSHEGLGGPARMAREIADVRRIIAKIGLLLRHWPACERLDPEPRFAAEPQPPPAGSERDV